MNENWTGKESDVSDTVRVPREPTEEMVEAGYRAIGGPRGIYRAMLSAAPQSSDANPEEILRMHRNEDAFHHLLSACQQALIRPAGVLDEAELAKQLRWAIKISHGEVGRFSDDDDPEGCRHCGAIAGACDAYPNCPGGQTGYDAITTPSPPEKYKP